MQSDCERVTRKRGFVLWQREPDSWDFQTLLQASPSATFCRLQRAASALLYGRSGATSPLLPPLCTLTSLLTFFGWHSPSSAFPNPPRLGITFIRKSGSCNDFHFLKSTLDPRLTRREDIRCTWDHSQVSRREKKTKKPRVVEEQMWVLDAKKARLRAAHGPSQQAGAEQHRGFLLDPPNQAPMDLIILIFKLCFAVQTLFIAAAAGHFQTVFSFVCAATTFSEHRVPFTLRLRFDLGY